MVLGKRMGWLFAMLVAFALSFPGIIPHAEGQEAAPAATPAKTPAEAPQEAQQVIPEETKKEQPDTARKKKKKKRKGPRKLLNTGGRGRFGISLLVGAGIQDHFVGLTTDGDDITLSAGGGIGFALTGGYGLSPKWDIEVSAGHQVSVITPSVSNGDGEFNRDFLRATLFYKMPFTRVTQWKIGAGIGAYLGGEWEEDIGPDEITEYDDALGFHVAGEFEVVVAERLYFAAGIKYYYVTYETNAATATHSELNGSGVDLMLSMGKYF